MPTWEEVAGLGPADPGMSSPDMQAIEGALKQLQERVMDAARAVPAVRPQVPLNGPEPGPHVTALRRPGDDDVFLCRCRRRGWWWSDTPEVPPGRLHGWAWTNARNSYPDESWEDVSPPPPSPEPAAELAAGPGAEPGQWTFAGPPPPPHVVRLENLNASAHDRQTHVARAGGGGWWWVSPEGENPVSGWKWAPDRHSTEHLVAVYPEVVDDESDLVLSMVRALPRDGKWYRVATTPGGHGVPIWGMMEHDGDDDDWNTWTSHDRPSS